jgi:hypothetical protein
MNAFRLQTFTPAEGFGERRQSEAERRLEAAREEAYRAGFVAGQAAATESHLDDETRLTAELVEAIGDACMTNEAARRHVAESLAPALRALAAAIAPALADAGICDEIARLAARAVAVAPEARPRLRCAPELVARVEALLAERGIAASVEAAPELLPREARVLWDQGYDQIDLQDCIAKALACIAAHIEPQSEEAEDDQIRYG